MSFFVLTTPIDSVFKQSSPQRCRYRLVSVCFLDLLFLTIFLKTCCGSFVSRGV